LSKQYLNTFMVQVLEKLRVFLKLYWSSGMLFLLIKFPKMR